MNVGKHRKTVGGLLAVEIPGAGSVHKMDLAAYMKDHMAELLEGLGDFDPVYGAKEWKKYCRGVELDGEEAELETVPLTHRMGAFLEMFAAGVGRDGPFSRGMSLPVSESRSEAVQDAPELTIVAASETSSKAAARGADTPTSRA